MEMKMLKMSSSCLPEELVMEILSYVPAKSLMKFKCVSKTWYHFISYDSSFAKLHFKNSTNVDSSFKNSSIIFYDTDNRFFTTDCNVLNSESTYIELIPPFDKSGFSIIGSYSGLVCLANKMNPKDSGDIYIWNPCTRDYIAIPLPSLPYDLPPFEELYQGFGFSYDRESNEYRVVMILSKWDTCSSYIQVYTSGKGLWEFFYTIHYYFVCCNRSNIFVNGALHWIANAPGEEYLIVSYDIKDEKFREILPPPLRMEDINTIEVCDLNGMLCVTCSERDLHYEEFHIWVMKEYGVDSSWVKQYVFQDFPLGLEPVYITDDGKLLAKDDSSKKLIKYNTNSNPGHEIFNHSVRQVYPYVRSLVSLGFESAMEELKVEDHGKEEEKGTSESES